MFPKIKAMYRKQKNKAMLSSGILTRRRQIPQQVEKMKTRRDVLRLPNGPTTKVRSIFSVPDIPE